MEIMAFHLIKYNLLLGVSLHSSVKTTCSLFITLFLSLPLTAERENVIYVCFAHGKLFRVPFNIEFIHTFQVKVTRVYFKSPRYKYKVLSHFMSFYGSSFRLSFSSSSFFFFCSISLCLTLQTLSVLMRFTLKKRTKWAEIQPETVVIVAVFLLVMQRCY